MSGFTWLVLAIQDWLLLPVAMPFPHNFKKIFFPKYHPPHRSKRSRKIYADVPFMKEEGDEHQDRLFHPHTHRKYNAELCYVNQEDEKKDLEKCIGEIEAKIEEAKKSNNAKGAKYENLVTLLEDFKKVHDELDDKCEEEPQIK
eukprot:1570292-Rhodomonas_salina.1